LPSATLLSDDPSERARFRILLRDPLSYTFEAVASISDLEYSDALILPARLLTELLDAADHVFDSCRVLVYGPPGGLTGAYLAGASDYMKEPWEPEELLFRVETLIERGKTGHGAGNGEQRLIADTSDSPGTMEAGEARIDLSAEERRLLQALCRAPDGVATRRALAFALGVDAPTSSRAVDMRIARLRRRLQPLAGYDNPIVSVRGRGYRLNPSVPMPCG
jgi:hypothetical protein